MICVLFFLFDLSLQVNLFFLLNIIRVLVTKLRDTHRAESNMYMKAVRATLILVPLLGIQFVIIPWRPENRLAGEVYEYIMHILMHYQVGTTRGVLRRTGCALDAAWCRTAGISRLVSTGPSSG